MSVTVEVINALFLCDSLLEFILLVLITTIITMAFKGLKFQSVFKAVQRM